MIEFAMQSLLEAQKDPVLIRDEQGSIRFGNRAARILYGEAWGRIVQRKAEWKRLVIQCERMKQEFTARVKRKNSAGYSIELNLKVIPLWDASGSFAGTIERLDSSPSQHEPVRLSATALTMSVAHDLRSPLAILQNLTLLMERRFESRYVEMMRKQLIFCESIVNNFLEFAGERDPRMATVSLEEILGEVISEIPIPEDISLDIAAFEGLMVEGDPGQIRHLVMNLIQNAVESMDGKPGVVKIGVSAQDAMMCLRITDAGAGIEAEDLSRVFQPFYSTKLRGFGLGLAACKQIVDAHGGKMEVESIPGSGTTFRVYLPLAV